MPAGQRAYWKGFLRLSLVSISVELYAATTSTDSIAFHQIHKPSGKRVRYEKVVPGIGPIDTDDIVKGYEIDDDTYVIMEPEELDAIKLESKRTIDLIQFATSDEIDVRYFERPYYLVPDGDVSTEGYAVIRDALAQADAVGLGQMTLRGREYFVGVKALGNGLVLETLRYANELREHEQVFRDVKAPKIDKEMLSLAHELIARKTKPFDPTVFKDHYAAALRDLVEEKRKGHTIVATEEDRAPRGGNVIDLMAALRKSVEQDNSTPDTPPKGEPKTRPRQPARRGAAAAKRASARKRATS